MLKKKFIFLTLCLFFIAIITSACGSHKTDTAYSYIPLPISTVSPTPQQSNPEEQSEEQNNQEEANEVNILKVSKSLVSLLVGDEASVAVTLNDEDVTSQVTFTVSDETVATVENGKITGLGAGITTVEVSLANAESVSFVVYVTKDGGEVFALKVSKEKVSVAVGGEGTVVVTLEDVDVTDSVTYTVDDKSIATVDKGVITGVAKGTAMVTVSLENAGSTTFTVDVISNPFVGATKGSEIDFGSYFYEVDGEFKPVTWQVLDKKDNRLLVVSKYVLDGCHIDTSFNGYKYKWADSDMCKFLNGYFYNTAFNDAEKRFIYSTPLVDVDSEGGTYNVFLLSDGEINEYFASNDERRCEPTPYATLKCYNWNGYAEYWLRTANSSNYIYFVYNFGGIGNYNVHNTNPGARPALWINL